MKHQLLGIVVILSCLGATSCARVLPTVGEAVLVGTLVAVTSTAVEMSYAAASHAAESAHQAREYDRSAARRPPTHPRGPVVFPSDVPTTGFEGDAVQRRSVQRQRRPELTVPQVVDSERPPLGQ